MKKTYTTPELSAVILLHEDIMKVSGEDQDISFPFGALSSIFGNND